MNRHAIVGRLGAGDKIKVQCASDEMRTEIKLLDDQGRLDHSIGTGIDEVAALGLQPTETAVDLVILAALVHAADTRISRMTESQDSWTRETRLVVPVSDVVRWRAAAPLLKRALDFLTGDLWTLGFRPRPKGLEHFSSTPSPMMKPAFDGVSLFSGGLDSLIGAIDEIQSGRAPLLVSHAGDPATSAAQECLFAAIKEHYGNLAVERLRFWMVFSQGLIKDVPSDSTTRARSFLFFALGVFAGSGLGKPFVLRVPENGLIAVNVPLDPLRVGALSTRTTHPFYIARWNEFLKILAINAVVENPYWNLTKGEMADRCLNKSLLKKLVPDSLSCASPTKGRWAGHGTQHCGHCLPCLIRRASLRMAFGKSGDATTYTLDDMTANPLDTRQASGEQVRSFQVAIQRLKANPTLANVLVRKPGPLNDQPTRIAELADVYRRGMFEIDALLKGVVAKPR